jgi:hypothetical protein
MLFSLPGAGNLQLEQRAYGNGVVGHAPSPFSFPFPFRNGLSTPAPDAVAPGTRPRALGSRVTVGVAVEREDRADAAIDLVLEVVVALRAFVE